MLLAFELEPTFTPPPLGMLNVSRIEPLTRRISQRFGNAKDWNLRNAVIFVFPKSLGFFERKHLGFVVRWHPWLKGVIHWMFDVRCFPLATKIQ